MDTQSRVPTLRLHTPTPLSARFLHRFRTRQRRGTYHELLRLGYSPEEARDITWQCVPRPKEGPR